MKKLRDFIYNFNDIFVALLIIIVAAGVIFWRVNAIMDYSGYVASRSEEKPVEQDTSIEGIDLNEIEVGDFNTNPEDANSDTLETEVTVQPDQQPVQQPAEEPVQQPTVVEAPKEVSFTVPNGSSAGKIADLLIQAGFVEDKAAFIAKLKELKADTKLKAGTFTITTGSTMEEIITILTK